MKTVKEYISEAIVKGKLKQYNNNDGCVDLGLSVKWAACNLGADTPEDIGNYYQWGGNKPTIHALLDDYPFCDTSIIDFYDINYTKYNEDDNKKELDNEDDIAYKVSKGNLRMPTKEEMEELVDKCIFQLIHNSNNKSVLKVIGPNKNSIIIPIGGYGSYNKNTKRQIMNTHDTICLWTKTISEKSSAEAWSLYGNIIVNNEDMRLLEICRLNTYNIRPVSNK